MANFLPHKMHLKKKTPLKYLTEFNLLLAKNCPLTPGIVSLSSLLLITGFHFRVTHKSYRIVHDRQRTAWLCGGGDAGG